jgi:hydrogenase expression/formation protein HypE
MTQTGPHPLKAVLFDFDGTLTIPGALDFPAIRVELGCPAGQPILEFIQSIQDPPGRRRLMERLTAIETSAAGRSRPNVGAQELVRWLKTKRLAIGILTRNSRQSVLQALENFDAIDTTDFDLIISRDDPICPKPSGEGIVWAAQRLHLQPGQILVVGDFVFDCQAGRAAGAPTVLLDPCMDPRLQTAGCDYRIARLNELKNIVKSSSR